MTTTKVDRGDGTFRYVKTTVGESRTKQSFKKETDINNILGKFRKTNLIDHVAKHRGSYGDFTGYPQSYHEAVQQVFDAEEMFGSLPSDIRARFDNDPGKFLAFAEDPVNESAMRDLGLLPSERAAEQPPARSEPAGAVSSAEGDPPPPDAP